MVILEIEESIKVLVMAEYEDLVQREGNMDIEVDLIDVDLVSRSKQPYLKTSFWPKISSKKGSNRSFKSDKVLLKTEFVY